MQKRRCVDFRFYYFVSRVTEETTSSNTDASYDETSTSTLALSFLATSDALTTGNMAEAPPRTTAEEPGSTTGQPESTAASTIPDYDPDVRTATANTMHHEMETTTGMDLDNFTDTLTTVDDPRIQTLDVDNSTAGFVSTVNSDKTTNQIDTVTPTSHPLPVEVSDAPLSLNSDKTTDRVDTVTPTSHPLPVEVSDAPLSFLTTINRSSTPAKKKIDTDNSNTMVMAMVLVASAIGSISIGCFIWCCVNRREVRARARDQELTPITSAAAYAF